MTIIKATNITWHESHVAREEREGLAALAEHFGEEDLTRQLQLALDLYSLLHHSASPRFHAELGLLKLLHARRLVPLEELLSQVEGAPPGGGPAPRGGPGRGPSPFESDLARKQMASAEPPVAAPAPAPADLRPAGPIPAQLLARLEQMSKGMLAVSLEEARAWQVTDREVVAYFPPDNGAQRLISREDENLVRQICSEVLARPVGFRVAVVEAPAGAPTADAGSEPQPLQPPGGFDRIRHDPQVAEFLRVFPGEVISFQDFKSQG